MLNAHNGSETNISIFLRKNKREFFNVKIMVLEHFTISSECEIICHKTR
jgi:hypothetical protein